MNSKLIIYTEDDFSKKWVEAIIRSQTDIAFDAIEVYAMGGDGTAVNANTYHNLDPSNEVKSICLIDGDSLQTESIIQRIYRLPGEAPEMHVFDQIVDILDECAAILAVRFMREFKDAAEVKETIYSISRTNRDHHLIFSQIGEAVGFVDENIIINAFLSTWCEKYKDKVTEIVNAIRGYLPPVREETNPLI